MSKKPVQQVHVTPKKTISVQVKKASKPADPDQMQALQDELRREISGNNMEGATPISVPVAPAPIPEDRPEDKMENQGPESTEHQREELAHLARKSWWHQDTLLSIVLAAGLMVIITLLILGKTQAPGYQPHMAAATPQQVVDGVQHAADAQDAEKVLQYADIEQLSSNIVEQLYQNPNVNTAVLPSDLQAQLQGMNASPAAVQAGLIQGLERDLKNIAAGDQEVKSLSGGVLVDVWQELSNNEPVAFGPVMQHTAADGTVFITTEVQRLLSGTTAPLTLELQQSENGWKIINLPYLATTLNTLTQHSEHTFAQVKPVESQTKLQAKPEQLAAVEPAAGAAKAEAQMPKAIETVKPEITKPQNVRANRILQVVSTSKVADGNAVLLQVGLKNTGNQAINSFRGTVTFADALGQPLNTIAIQDGIGLGSSGNIAAKVFRLELDETQRMNRHILKLPAKAMKIFINIEQLELADGTVLKS